MIFELAVFVVVMGWCDLMQYYQQDREYEEV